VDVREADSFKPLGKRAGVDEDHGVEDVGEPEAEARGAIGAGEDRAGLEDAIDLREELVLEGGRRDVVEHRHRNGAAEGGIVERHGRGIAVDDFDVRAIEAALEFVRELLVDFDGREVCGFLAEEVGGEARAGADFEEVVAEVDIAQGQGMTDDSRRRAQPGELQYQR